MPRCLGVIVLALLLSGCLFDPPKPAPPKVVYVTVDRYVSVDPELLKPCPIAEPADDTVGERVDVARQRKTSLQKCNADKAAIRAAQPEQ